MGYRLNTGDGYRLNTGDILKVKLPSERRMRTMEGTLRQPQYLVLSTPVSPALLLHQISHIWESQLQSEDMRRCGLATCESVAWRPRHCSAIKLSASPVEKPLGLRQQGVKTVSITIHQGVQLGRWHRAKSRCGSYPQEHWPPVEVTDWMPNRNSLL